MKTRRFEESNYHAIYLNGKTIRIQIDSNNPITELKYPEFYDIKITNKCSGSCKWCYQDSKSDDGHYDNIIEKFINFFSKLDSNQKPFQVAIGGGEPTSHPDFLQLLKIIKEFDIVPNYTTNGMFISNEIYTKKLLRYTKKYCGGVAVSCHLHLEKYWKPVISLFCNKKIKTNLHLIISDKNSIDYFVNIYNEYEKIIDYFVLLPYITQGRAVHKDIDWGYLKEKVDVTSDKIAFGANFYPYLIKDSMGFDVSLYEPEIMSKYIDFKDMKIYKSSFHLE